MKNSQFYNDISDDEQIPELSCKSSSEATLENLDNDLDISDEAANFQEKLKLFAPEERKNLLLNPSTGFIYDLSKNKTIQQGFNGLQKTKFKSNSQRTSQPTSKISVIKKQINWDEHWRNVQQTHQKLLTAICRNNRQQFDHLLNRKSAISIDINYQSASNWTPLHYAAMNASLPILSSLLNRPHIDINCLTNFEQTPLHLATINNKLENCCLLVNAGICIDYKDKDGNTALHYAAERGYKPIIEFLLSSGAAWLIKNLKNLRPMDISKTQDIIDLFPQDAEQDRLHFGRAKMHAKQVEKMLSLFDNKSNLVASNSPIITQQKKVSKKNAKNEARHKNMVQMYALIRSPTNQNVTLSNFKFYKKIGQGAFGQVYIVKKSHCQKLYALKAIRKERILGTNLYRYIQTEKEVLSLVSHPFIVKLHYALQNESYLFLVMEYCQGGDMGTLLERKKRFEERTVKMYMAQILLAVQVLHQNSILYRDLKPENIVIDKDGHALLTDFGLSKKAPDLDQLNGSFCGTPAYLPLEIINRRGHNRMADWYEFGVVLYELMFGMTPFFAETKERLYEQIRSGVIKFPKGTPQKFKDIVKKLLAQNPAKRLGFQNDAQSIKSHPWFEDINWEDVYNRKLPVPEVTKKVKIGEPIKSRFIDNKNQTMQIPSWSFVL